MNDRNANLLSFCSSSASVSVTPTILVSASAGKPLSASIFSSWAIDLRLSGVERDLVPVDVSGEPVRPVSLRREEADCVVSLQT